MRQSLRFLLFSVCLGWLFGGCSQKLEPKPITYSQLLTGVNQKTWKLVSFEEIDAGNRSGVIPINTQFNPCRADDQYVFYAGEERKFEYNNGPIKCNPTEQDNLLTDNWTLTNVNATLNFVIPTFNGGVLPYTVKNLTPTVMTVELYYDKLTDDNLNVSYRFTFNSVSTK